MRSRGLPEWLGSEDAYPSHREARSALQRTKTPAQAGYHLSIPLLWKGVQDQEKETGPSGYMVKKFLEMLRWMARSLKRVFDRHEQA